MSTPKKRRASEEVPQDEEERREDQDQVVTAALAITHMKFIRSLAEKQQKQRSLPEPKPKKKQPKPPIKKRKEEEKEISDKTLELLLEWRKNTPKTPPQAKLLTLVGQYSKPIQKQMTLSDVRVNQNRLMLASQEVKTKMLTLLTVTESEILRNTEAGLEVKVYGPDGEENDMRFKIWNTDKTHVLKTGWNDFVARYGIKMHTDILTIWMFRHLETGKICFAIDSTRFESLTKTLSSKILNAVFKVDD